MNVLLLGDIGGSGVRFAGMAALGDFIAQERDCSELLVREVHKLLGDLLFEVKLRVELLKGAVCLGKFLMRLGVGALGMLAQHRLISASGLISGLFHMLAQLRQRFHVALPALDLLVKNDAVEAFPPFIQLQGEIEISPGDEPKTVHELLNA